MSTTTYEDVLKMAEHVCGTTRSDNPHQVIGFLAGRLASVLAALEDARDPQATIDMVLSVYAPKTKAAPDVKVSGFTVADIHPANDPANVAPAIIEALSTK